MFRGRVVIDADSHKCENPVVFLDYVEAPHRDRISFVRDRFGEQRIRVLDRNPHGWPERLPRTFLQPEGWGKGTYRPYHEETTLGGLFNRVRLEHMDREGIDHQVIYGSVSLAFNSILDPELAVALCRAYNDYIRDDCAAFAGRLHPMGVLPLQDPSEAACELRRCVESLGLIGGMIPPNLPVPHPAAPTGFPEIRVPKHLSHADFEVVMKEAERLDVPLGIHGAPGLQLAGGASDQLDTFTLVHVFANRDMQQMALSKLIFDGILEAHPQLRFGFLEAGCGWLPDFLHSLYEHWEKRVVHLDPTLEPRVPEFLRELAWESRGKGAPDLLRRAAGLMRMLFSPAEDRVSEEQLRAFQREHPTLTRDPREYVERGQVFLTVAPDDPAPGWLGPALGDPGKRVCGLAIDYGHWDATLRGCVSMAAEHLPPDSEWTGRILGENALHFYGRRLRERIRC